MRKIKQSAVYIIILICNIICWFTVLNFFMSLRKMNGVLAIALTAIIFAIFVIGFSIAVDVVKSALHQYKFKQFLKLDHSIIGSKGIVHVDRSKNNQTSSQIARDSE